MADKFEQWGVVEIMGHQRAAGRMSEEVVAGASTAGTTVRCSSLE